MRKAEYASTRKPPKAPESTRKTPKAPERPRKPRKQPKIRKPPKATKSPRKQPKTPENTRKPQKPATKTPESPRKLPKADRKPPKATKSNRKPAKASKSKAKAKQKRSKSQQKPAKAPRCYYVFGSMCLLFVVCFVLCWLLFNVRSEFPLFWKNLRRRKTLRERCKIWRCSSSWLELLPERKRVSVVVFSRVMGVLFVVLLFSCFTMFFVCAKLE